MSLVKKARAPFVAFAVMFMFLPLFAFAQFGQIDDFFLDIIAFINNILVPLVFAIALLVFLWGVVKMFIIGGGDPETRKEGRQLILWAVIGFVVMVSIWGIVNVIAGGLNLDDDSIQNIPSAPRN